MDIWFAPVAKGWLDTQSSSIQQTILNFSRNPDDISVRTGTFLMAPATATIVYSESHWLIYYHSRGVRWIANVGNNDEEPNIWRT
jgi:hypothetical protein